MAFKLGNFAIKEIVKAVAQDFNDVPLYTLDQLSSASIEISSESTDITDKDGNIIRRIYRSKQGTFTATSAMLSPALLNAQSGSPMQVASADNKIEMPKILTVTAGTTLAAADAKEGTISVMGVYGNGANDPAVLTQGTEAVVGKSFKFADGAITVPAAEADAPTLYVVKYQRDVESGLAMANYADKFPDTIRLTLQVALIDPCDDQFKAAYLYIPSFQPDPSVTISLDSENQETDFSGNINVDFCGTEKLLYVLYIPESDTIVTGTTDGNNEEPAPGPQPPQEEEDEP